MLVKDLLNEARPFDNDARIMIERKAIRTIIPVLQKFAHKKWLPIFKVDSSNNKTGLFFNIDKEVDEPLFPTFPEIHFALTYGKITYMPVANIVCRMDLYKNDDFYYWSRFTDWLKKTDSSILKTPKMKSIIIEGLLETGYFDKDDIDDLYILGTDMSSINVSFPKLKVDIREIADVASRINDVMITNNMSLDYFIKAKNRLGIANINER